MGSIDNSIACLCVDQEMLTHMYSHVGALKSH